MKYIGKKYGSIFLFIFLFPYTCSLLFHGIRPVESKGIVENELMVIVKQDTGVEKIPMEEYIVGVLAATIPVDYEPETIKAQAIIIRTEMVKKYRESGNIKKKVEAESLAYSYLDFPARKMQWKDNFTENEAKIKGAVEDTKGLIMTYRQNPIEAPFFFLSAGRTRDAKDVLGKDIYPYLQSVNSTNDILAKEYQQKKAFSFRQLKEKLESQKTEKELKEIEITKTDKEGYVLEVSIGEETWLGEDFRKKIGLNSSHFTFEIIENHICFTTRGIGHGLGFSQYGANQMALEGNTFLEILPYYYTGIELEKQ